MIELPDIDYDKKTVDVKIDGEPVALTVHSLSSIRGARALNLFLKYIEKKRGDGVEMFKPVYVLGEEVDTETTDEYKKASAWLSAQLSDGWPDDINPDELLVEHQGLANIIYNAADNLAKEFAEKKQS